MDFVAIDFETANEQPHSACQLGVVVVRGGEVVGRHEWLIRPRPLRFSWHNVQVHGIRAEDVRGEAEFAELWQAIRQTLGDDVLVAHNARFDMGVLKACLEFHQLGVPDLQFTCTRALARKAWPGQAGYGLRALADRLGISFQHHDALEDAEACARVLLEAAKVTESTSLVDLELRLQLSRGRAGHWGIGGPRGARYRGVGSRGARTRGRREEWYRQHQAGKFVQQELDFSLSGRAMQAGDRAVENGLPWSQMVEIAEQKQPLQGETVVLTGVFEIVQRERLEDLVVRAGGKLAAAVTKKTTRVAVGQPDQRTLAAGRSKSTKQARAEALQTAGQAITIVSEQEFLAPFLEEGEGKDGIQQDSMVALRGVHHDS